MIQKLFHISLLLIPRNQTQVVIPRNQTQVSILFGHNKKQILYFHFSAAKNIAAPHTDTIYIHTGC